MASAPFHPSVPGPTSSAHPQGTLEWGAAVHGSSACLQAMHQGYPPTFGAGAALPQPYQADAQVCATQAVYSSSYQESAYGYPEHHPYSHAQQAHAASGQYPQYPAWPGQSVSNSCQYPPCTTHAQYYQYAQQYAWQSFHCHSAVQDPAAAVDGGDGWDSWKGWVSYSGARQTPPSDSNPTPIVPSANGKQHSPEQQQQQLDTTQGSGQADNARDPKQEERQSADGAGGAEAAAAVEASTATGPGTAAPAGADDLYDPLAHADADTLADVNAASALDSSPTGTKQKPATITRREGPTAAAPATLAEAHERKDNDGGGGGKGGSVLPAAVAAAATLAGSAVTAPPAQATDLIVVWDLDETLIIFKSLLSGAFAKATAGAAGHGKKDSTGPAAVGAAAAAPAGAAKTVPATGSDSEADVRNVVVEPGLSHRAAELGNRLAEMVFNFCDNHMSFLKLDFLDPVTFLELWSLAASASEPGKAEEAEASSGFRTVDRSSVERIASIYTDSVESLSGLMGDEELKERASVLADAEQLTGGWVAAARQLLAGVTAAAAAGAAASQPSPGVLERPMLTFRSVRHVLVSAGHLIATLGKLVLWDMHEYFDIGDIYSASGRPKLEIFRSLRTRFGPTAAYAAVGDGLEEERAAAVMGWGFVRVGFSAAAGSASGPAQVHVGQNAAAEPWRVPRPVQDIRPEDVLEAARRAY
ncbi:hypothetical protein Vretifemale_6280 [Volvox reticuliferus]|uniref:protein-tyrosine-phosphatase n=1 Tax=Volvox reticuliferus TaxID=1737510 RepID=A0A8J4C9T5_9CHLO|nr:hypothetical protein Vretifemale_6280 [Volvox reticuliferus]